MKTIHRYKINNAINEVEIPMGAETLSVGVCKEITNSSDGSTPKVKEVISIWFEVDDSAPKEKRTFLIFGTGANMDETANFDRKFIGTVRKANDYAFHVFEVNNNTNH